MTEKFIKTAVIGHPIAHSKSPIIHNYWLNKYGIDGSYEAIDIHPDNLKDGVLELINKGYSGFNVTIPHKISIIDVCDKIDDLARMIGAVNTVTIKNGKLYGTNTDAYGFVQNIKETVEHENNSWSFKNGKAAVLGAGGAANAILYALLKEGVPQIALTNRTQKKAWNLAKLDPEKITVIDWENRNDIFSDANLIINTTSLGMTGKPMLEIDLTKSNPNALVTDIVYAPLYTDMLKQAKDKNMRIVTGIGMLIHQARPGFKKWNGVLPNVTQELESMVLA